jgi:hypothetical protein
MAITNGLNDSTNYTGLDRAMMVKVSELKTVRNERMLYQSELRALDRGLDSSPHVAERKKLLRSELPKLEMETETLAKDLIKMINHGGDQLNPSSKHYVMAEKLVNQQQKAQQVQARQ